MPITKPFTVIQNGKPLFTVHAYSLDQARAIAAAMVAGEVIVVQIQHDVGFVAGHVSLNGAAR